MSIRSIHANIKGEILKEIEKAQFSIYVAVAWFTDEDLFNLLCKKAAHCIAVQVILHNDLKEVNSINFSKNGLDFPRLHFCGGEIYLLKGHHNKYCIIDGKIYLSGSYNWTFGASMKQDGFESLEIYEDADLAKSKQEAFNNLLSISVSYLDALPKISTPKVEISRLIFFEFKQITNHLIQAIVVDFSGKTYLTFYIPGYYNKTTIDKVSIIDEENGTRYISPNTHFIVFENCLWLLLKKKR